MLRKLIIAQEIFAVVSGWVWMLTRNPLLGVAPEPDSFRAFAQFWGHACAIFAAVAVCLES